MEKIVTFKDFTKIDLRVGTIVKVTNFPEARKPAYKLTIDFGSLGLRKTSAQITIKYKKEQLLSRQVIALINIPKRQIVNIMSECLILGAVNANAVTLLKPEHQTINGSSVS